MARTILVMSCRFTGAALSQRLLLQGDRVVGLDNLNHYDPNLSKLGCDRLKVLLQLEPEVCATISGRRRSLKALFVEKGLL